MIDSSRFAAASWSFRIEVDATAAGTAPCARQWNHLRLELLIPVL